jgi:hypothetical protein
MQRARKREGRKEGYRQGLPGVQGAHTGRGTDPGERWGQTGRAEDTRGKSRKGKGFGDPRIMCFPRPPKITT